MESAGSSAEHLEELRARACDVSGPERDDDVTRANPLANRIGQIVSVFYQGHIAMPVRTNRLGESTRIGPFDWFFACRVDVGQE